MSDNHDVNRAIRRLARPQDRRYWTAEDWDAAVEQTRSEAIAEEAKAKPKTNANLWDAGARTTPPQPVDTNAAFNAELRRKRDRLRMFRDDDPWPPAA